jgi:PAS domain S-box-containing protein
VITGTGQREEARPAVDDLPIGAVAIRDDGCVVHANAFLLQLLGYSREEVEGKHVEILLSVAGKIFFQTHLYPLVRLGHPAQELFVLLRHKDGSQVGCLVNARRRSTGQSPITDCVFMEVRERGKFEEALLRAKKEAEQRGVQLAEANRLLEEQALELEMQQQHLHDQAAELEEASSAKSRFLAVMSHELRTPLNAIGGYVELIELGVHGEITAGQREALDRVARAQRHLLRLINDILNLSRIEAGRVDYAVEPVDIRAVVESVVPMVEPQAAAASVRIDRQVTTDVVARADREKVQQILINLLTNAVKFTPAGGAITVTASRRDDRVVVDVRDTGIGIPAEKLPSIFEPFVQVDTSHVRREGTGLGLAISRDLARGMGGDLTVESVLERGSTFHLSLPSQQA